MKSAQRHRLAPGALPHDILDEILNQMLSRQETQPGVLCQLHVGPLPSGGVPYV